MVVIREMRKQRTVLEDQEGESLQVQRREGGVEGSDEVFVEPLRLFDLEAYSLNGFELFLRKVDNEAYA